MADKAETDWIEWNGGECPVPMPQVAVRYRDGDTCIMPLDLLEEGDWQHDDLDGENDIIAYRVVSS